VSEINRLEWDDVNFKDSYISLYTRKKAGGNFTPRNVPMTGKLYGVLFARYQERDQSKPWLFWHSYRDAKGLVVNGPYKDRKKFMRTLCKEAKVPYFRFHGLRHSGVSLMDKSHVPIGSIQRILGHENRKTTEIYLHMLGDSERQAMALYEMAARNSHTDLHTATKKVGLRFIFQPNSLILIGITGAPSRIRTCDLRIRRQ